MTESIRPRQQRPICFAAHTMRLHAHFSFQKIQRLETVTISALSWYKLLRVESALDLSWKGQPLRTATSRKATKAPSPAGLAPASHALNTILTSLEDGKAEEIVSIDIQGKSSLADHMVIASGRSNRHVAAVSDQIISALKDAGLGAPKVEGLEGADWVLIDAGDVIVHVFRPEVRTFYNLEKMWTAPDIGESTRH